MDEISEGKEPHQSPKATGSGSLLSWFAGKLARLKGPIVAVAAVGAVLSGMVGYWNTYRTVRGGVAPAVATNALPADAGPLSIVVLPFANLTGDPAQAYVADGLTASVTADLSRIRDAFVVGTGSALAFKDKALTAQQVGKELGVRFVLQGNVQRSGSKMRINAQLTDSASNAQLWSEAFDGETGDLFALQDQVTTLIGNSMGRELVVRAARESERRTSSSTVADLLLRARAMTFKRLSLADLQEQEAVSRKALALEPGNVEAMSFLAMSLTTQAANFGRSLGKEAKEKAIAEAVKICARIQATDPENLRLYLVLGQIALLMGDLDGSLRAHEKYLALAPKQPVSYINLANLLHYRVQPQRALALLQKALALDPKNPRDLLLLNLSWVEFMLGDYDAAIAWALKFRESNPTFRPGESTLAVAYAMKGDRERARAAMEASIKADPTNTVSANVRNIEDPANHVNPAYRAWFLQTYVPAMRLAGYPE